MINLEHKKILDEWLNHADFIKMAEGELGAPVDIEVDWENEVINLTGSDSEKQITISEFCYLVLTTQRLM